MRKVLIVAYYFPPQGGAGVQRTLKFVKYLPEFGWQPVVLTVEAAGRLQDPSLLAEIPDDVAVYRTPALHLPSWWPWRVRHFITRWLLLIDEQIGWLPFAVAAGRRIAREEGIAALYTTSAPYTAHLIGLQLKRQTGLPWFADFRDPWADNFTATYATAYHHRQVHRLERKIFAAAERIGVTSERQRTFYTNKYNAAAKTKVLTLTNGYDAEDFQASEPQPFHDPSHFTLVYTGSLYGKQQTARYFLQGLRRALDEGNLPAQQVKVFLVGNVGQETLQLVNELDLSHVVFLTGYKSHSESIRYLLSADVLLLILGQSLHSDLVIPGKLFEYLAAQRQILALAASGATTDLLQAASIGVIISPENIPGIAAQLGDLYEAWNTGKLSSIAPDLRNVQTHERRVLTARLAAALNTITTR